MTLQEMLRDRDADRALRLAVATPNCDPADVVIARESAAELLDGYLEHVTLNRAARRIIEQVTSR